MDWWYLFPTLVLLWHIGTIVLVVVAIAKEDKKDVVPAHRILKSVRSYYAP